MSRGSTRTKIFARPHQNFDGNRLAKTLRALAAALLAVCGALGCRAKSLQPPPFLAKVPDGYGKLAESDMAVLTVRDGALVLRSEKAGSDDLQKELKGKKLAIELDRSLRMADLSSPLSKLSEIIEKAGEGRDICFEVADSVSLRCVYFRPFSGDQFSEWLDAEKPLGKIRVVMRADGMEVVADRGKVPGPDRFGPSLPSIGAMPDYDGLDSIMSRLAGRFPSEDTAGLVPSAALTVEQTARVLGILSGRDGKRFARTFLVFP